MINLKSNIHDLVISEVNLKILSKYTFNIFKIRFIRIIAWPVYHTLKKTL
jgi:hypothetical protein